MRFGVIGTNFISQEFVQAGQTLDGFVLRAVYSRRLETAAAFADRFGGAECLTTLDDLAEHPEIMETLDAQIREHYHFDGAEKEEEE